jgi:hypothetical protein
VQVATKWLLPLFAQTLRPQLLYRLWDQARRNASRSMPSSLDVMTEEGWMQQLFLERDGRPLLCTALVVLRGADREALLSFDTAMPVLSDGPLCCYDPQPFMEQTLAYMHADFIPATRRRAARWRALLDAPARAGLLQGMPLESSANLVLRGSDGSAGGLDGWQRYRLALPFAAAVAALPANGGELALPCVAVAAVLAELVEVPSTDWDWDRWLPGRGDSHRPPPPLHSTRTSEHARERAKASATETERAWPR